MKKFLSIFMAFFAMFLLTPNVNAETKGEMTADDLVATAENKVITLDGDVILTTNLVVDGNIEVINLNNHTIILKGCIDWNRANPIVVNSKLEIKDGTITRYVLEENASGYSLERGSLVIADGSRAELTLNKVILDGKELKVSSAVGYDSHAISIRDGASLTINDSTLQNNHSIGVYGAALYANAAKNIFLNNTTIKNSHTTKGGAAIYAENTESVLVQKSTISDSITDGIGNVKIENCGSFVFDKDSVIKNNKAGEASGIHITDTNSTIAGTIEGNETTLVDGLGGGLYTYLNNTNKTITITETAVIKNNKAAAGAGILVNGPDVQGKPGNVIMNGGIITGNTAVATPDEGTLRDGGGAGIYVYRGVMTINGGTIENNISTSGIGSAIVVSHQNRNLDAGSLEIKGGTIKGSIALGNGNINISGGTYSEQPNANYIVSPYIIKQENSMYVIGLDSNDVILDYIEITPNKEVSGELKEVEIGISDDDRESVNDILLNSLNINKDLVEGATDVKVQLEFETTNISEDDKKLIEESLKEGKIATYLNIDVNVYADGNKVGKISELTDKIKLTVMLPEALKNVESGYTRKYYIVTVHDGVANEIEATLSENGKYLTFETSEFSTYAIAYEDVVSTSINPDTGDNAIIYGLIGTISLIGIAGMLVYTKKRYA